MSTLAQRFAESDPRDLFVNPGKNELEIFDWCMGLINPPMVGQDEQTVLNFRNRARRFVFDEEPYSTIQPFIKAGSLDTKMVAKMARFPSEAIWVEWQTKTNSGAEPEERVKGRLSLYRGGDREGFLGLELEGRTYFVHFIGIDKHRAVPFVAYKFTGTLPPEADDMGKIKAELMWVHPTLAPGPKDDTEGYIQKLVNNCVISTIDSLFLLMTPRVAEITDKVHDPKLQRRRAKTGKPPFLDYQSVKVKIGKAPDRGKAKGVRAQLEGQIAEGAKRRLHDVIGHFRYRGYGGKDKEVHWVPPHFRGSAELGIIIKDRTLTRN